VNADFAEGRRDAGAWLKSHAFELWVLTGVWAVLTVVIYLLATGHESPRRYQDEFLFWALAKNFAHGGGLTWRGVGLDLRSWLYPVELAPAFWFAKTVPGQFTGVHLINSLMICATLFPAFLMARLFVGPRRAMVAALLAVAVPAMNYAGVIATENLGYPVFTAACGAILLSIARPRPPNTALAVVLVLAAMLTRTQFVVLPAIWVGTLLLAALFAGPGRRVGHLKQRSSDWIALACMFLLGGLFVLAQGKGSAGLYSGVFDGIALQAGELWFWVKAFAADVYLLCAIVPVIATFALAGGTENRRDPLFGALIALAIVASLVFVLQISWFSATNPYQWRQRHIFYERYMFYLGPIFFTGLLAAWKRVSWPSALFSSALATVVVSGFQTDAVLVPFSYDSFGLSLVGRYISMHPDAGPRIGMELARLTLVLGAVYVAATLPQRVVRAVAYWAAVLFTFVALIATQGQTWHYARMYSSQAFEQFPRPATFIDRNTDQPVGMIITSTDDPLSYFTTEFWNNRVVRAFATDAAPISSPVMYSPRCEFDWSRSGEILGTGCDLVPSAWYLRSDNVVMHLKDETKRVHPSAAWPTLTLMVGEPPPRILSLSDGRNVRTGQVQGAMNIRTFLGRPGELRLRLRSSANAVVVRTGARSLLLRPGERRTLTVRVPADEHVTSVTVKTLGGIPDFVRVTGADLREGAGAWTSIL
jgi:hypothetical protein